MGVQHTQKTAVDCKNGQPTTPNTGGKILFLTIFDRAIYSGLFKASTVFFAIWLIGASQTALTLYDKEIDAYTDKFKFEASSTSCWIRLRPISGHP